MPEASQRFSELAGAVHNNFKTRIWNAFLSLHAQNHEAPATRPDTPPRSTSQVAESAARRVRPNGATGGDKSKSATTRRDSAASEIEWSHGDENGQMEFDVRAIGAPEVAMLEALPEVKRLAQSLAGITGERELKRLLEQEILVDADTAPAPPARRKSASTAPRAPRVVWRFAGTDAEPPGLNHDALIKIRRIRPRETMKVGLSSNVPAESPKAPAPADKQACPSTLANPAPSTVASPTYSTMQAFDTRM